MANLQKNEIEQIKNEINLLQDRLKKNQKSLNQLQTGLMKIKRIWVKKGQTKDLSQTKKIQNIVNNIIEYNIKNISK